MSKIGRKPIDISGVTVDVKGQEVHYKGPKASGIYRIPEGLTVRVEDNKLYVVPVEEGSPLKKRDVNRLWGMHRALFANEIAGSKKEFEKTIEIVGLGYKAKMAGNKIVFTIGYSHDVDFAIPKGVGVEVDKKGQKLVVKSSDFELLGKVCDKIRSIRRTEPYKGTGIKLSTDVVIRKDAKGK